MNPSPIRTSHTPLTAPAEPAESSLFRRLGIVVFFLPLLVVASLSCAPDESKDDSSKKDDTEEPSDNSDKGDGDLEPSICARSFDYGTGFPCNFDSDCLSGHCVDDGFRKLCATACSSSSPCPQGQECTPLSEGESFCLPAFDAPLPFSDRSLEQGSPCYSDLDCADGGFCTNLDGVWICASPCQDSSECGECASCRSDLQNPAGDGNLCAPRGEIDIGKACQSAYECSSFECHGFCTQQCTFEPCPEGTVCQYVGGFSVCAAPEQEGATASGKPCWYDFECAGGSRCQLNAEGERVCGVPRAAGEECDVHEECADGLRCVPNELRTAQLCALPGPDGASCFEDMDCEEGHSCREFALNTGVCTRDCAENFSCGTGSSCVSAEVDTYVQVFDLDNPAVPIEENDDLDYFRGLLWSRLAFNTGDARRFVVRVRTLANVGGPYRLRIIPVESEVEPELEIEWIRETENPDPPGINDTLESAQQLSSLPAYIEGSLNGAQDMDHYAFTLEEANQIRIETERAAPSSCLSDSVLASIELGQPCSFHYQCGLDRICDTSLGACTADCTEDMTSCPTGFACMDLDRARACVPQQSLRQKALGESCTYTFECDDNNGQHTVVCAGSGGDEPRCELRENGQN